MASTADFKNGLVLQIDDPQRHRKSQSGTARFGGETKIKDAAQVLGVNPAALVGDRNLHDAG